jgi:hypothetical protein
LLHIVSHCDAAKSIAIAIPDQSFPGPGHAGGFGWGYGNAIHAMRFCDVQQKNWMRDVCLEDAGGEDGDWLMGRRKGFVASRDMHDHGRTQILAVLLGALTDIKWSSILTRIYSLGYN